MKAVDVKVEYGEPVEAGQDRGIYRTVGDLEHAQIVQLYMEGLSMNKIADEIGRSTKTVHDHLRDHNRSVERSAFCPARRRVHSEYESDFARRETSSNG